MRTAVTFYLAGSVVLGAAALGAVAAQGPTAPLVMMDMMTTTEVRDAIAAGKNTVLIYNASTEQSGPHVVLGKHTIHARYLGERIARELGNALVAPVIPYSPTGAELLKFPGTIDLRPETLASLNEDIAASMVKAGFKYIILTGNHGGNQETIKALAPKLAEKYKAEGVRVFFSGAAYSGSGKETSEYAKAHNFPPSGHGGIADTSTLWAACPQGCVRADKIAMGDPMNRVPGQPTKMGPKGVEGDPRLSSIEVGKFYNDVQVKNAVAEIRGLVSQK
jgi:creatinine amidohydrolase